MVFTWKWSRNQLKLKRTKFTFTRKNNLGNTSAHVVPLRCSADYVGYKWAWCGDLKDKTTYAAERSDTWHPSVIKMNHSTLTADRLKLQCKKSRRKASTLVIGEWRSGPMEAWLKRRRRDWSWPSGLVPSPSECNLAWMKKCYYSIRTCGTRSWTCAGVDRVLIDHWIFPE